MDLRFVTAFAAGLVVCACGSPPPATDGGIDGGAEEVDGGPSDAGEPDAPPDAGPAPTPEAVARDDARMGMTGVDTALSAIPVATRTGVEFLELEMVMTRIDGVIGEKIGSLIDIAGVIGEKSMAALALPLPAIPAMLIVQQLDRAILELEVLLDGSSWAASADPMLMALGTACQTLHDDLATLRDLLLARYRAIVDTTMGMAFRVDPEYTDSREVLLVAGSTDLRFVLEGRDATDPTASLTVDCGSTIPTIDAFDLEAGRIHGPETPAGMAPYVVTLTLPNHADPRVISVRITAPATGGWTSCHVMAASTRSFRGVAEPIDGGEQGALSIEHMDHLVRSSALESEIARARSVAAVPEDRLQVLERFEREASAATSRLRDVFQSQIEAEDYEMLQLELEQVILPMSDVLGADPAFGGTSIPTELDALETTYRNALIELAPGHVGPAA